RVSRPLPRRRVWRLHAEQPGAAHRRCDRAGRRADQDRARELGRGLRTSWICSAARKRAARSRARPAATLLITVPASAKARSAPVSSPLCTGLARDLREIATAAEDCRADRPARPQDAALQSLLEAFLRRPGRAQA